MASARTLPMLAGAAGPGRPAAVGQGGHPGHRRRSTTSLGVAGALLDVDATAMFPGSGGLVVLVAGASGLARHAAAFDAPPPARLRPGVPPAA